MSPPRSRHADARGRRVRRLWALASASVAIVLAMTGGVAWASVESDARFRGVLLDGVYEGHTFTDLFMGSYRKSGSGVAWFCKEFGVPISDAGQGQLDWGQTEQQRRAAYIISEYASSTSSTVHAAIALAVHDLIGANELWQQKRELFRAAADHFGGAGVSALSDRMRAEAQQELGPWTLSAPEIAVAADRRSALVVVPSIHTASGAAVQEDITLRVSGAAVWESTGTRELTVTSGTTTRQRLRITEGGTDLTVSASASAAPSGIQISTISGSQQQVATAGRERIASDAREFVPDWAVSPRASTIAPARILPGEALTDQVTVLLDAQQEWPEHDGQPVPATFSVAWFYSGDPLPELSDVPEGEPFGVASLTVSAPGEYRVQAPDAPDGPGYYYPVVSFERSGQPEEFQTYFTGDWSARVHEPSEETLVVWTPQVTTRTSHDRADVGDAVRDLLVVSGNAPGHRLDIVSTLWGPIAEKPELVVNEDPQNMAPPIPDGVPAVGTVTTTVEGNGEFYTEGIVLSDPGYYVWTETIAETDATQAWNSGWAASEEVSLRVYEPQVVTRASDAIVSVGSRISDVLEVSGNDPQATVEIVSTLYGPLPEAPEHLVNDTPWLAEPILPSADLPVAATVTTVVAGNGVFETEAVTVDRVGYYVWVETIAPTSTTAGWAGDFGMTAETVQVIAHLVESSTDPAGSAPPVLAWGVMLALGGLGVLRGVGSIRTRHGR